MKITLTEKDISKARDFAFELVRKGKKGTFENYFIGTLGEIAYAKFAKLKVNFDVYDRGVGDGGADFKNVQVKTVGWSGPNKILKVSLKDRSLTNENINKFVLAHATVTNPTEVQLVGEISREEFLKNCLYSNIWKAKVISEKYLHDIKESS
jgi:hypothetical protein